MKHDDIETYGTGIVYGIEGRREGGHGVARATYPSKYLMRHFHGAG
jgi:hypothetical protein